MTKVTIIGAGDIGSNIAFQLAQQGYFKILLYDIEENRAEGKALDIMHGLSSIDKGQFDTVIGSNDISLMRGSDIVVIACGKKRVEAVSRDDLFNANLKIIQSLAERVKKHAPHSLIIMITKPVDSMTWAFYNHVKWPREKIIGLSGTLDEARFRYYLSVVLNVDIASIKTKVIGTHNDTMIPLLQYTYIDGVPIKHFIEEKKIDEKELAELVYETRESGSTIIKLLKTQSSHFGPAASIIKIIEAFVEDKKTYITASSFFDEEVFIGQNILFGCNGVEEIVKLKIDNFDQKLFTSSVEKLRQKHRLVKKVS